ncbi:putative mitochondrial 2-oxodicarboxylate carrier [Diplonema papillatum]|nr:putative mitochondrial 2-oxodicarboxylate carrier [Diplonema papillatum]
MGKMDVVGEVAAGGLAGIAEYSTCQPVEIVATRCMLREGRERSSMAREFREVWGSGGVRALYRGLGPQVLAAVPATIGMYAGEKQFAKLLRDADGHLSNAGVFASGMASGVSETTLVCPFEVAKVRLMSSDYASQYRNTVDCFVSIARNEGFGVFYTGYAAMSTRNIIFNSTYFFGVHSAQAYLPVPTSTANGLMQDCATGMCMGFMASFPKMPFFIAKTRLQNQGSRRVYTGMLQTIQHIFQNDGPRGLWKGVLPAGMRMGLGSAVCLPAFRFLCAQFTSGDAEAS